MGYFFELIGYLRRHNNFNVSIRVCLVALLFFGTRLDAQVQDLPAMKIETENAKNILSWNCQFDGVKSIAVQRSTDSVKNYVTIGVIDKPKKGGGRYVDMKPVQGKNYYRLSVNFIGDVEWFSNTYKVYLDSATIAKSIEGSINSGTTNSISAGNTNTSNGTTTPVTTEFYYTPSSRVFTNPYTGHININLEDALSKRYSIRFYTPDKEEVVRISRVTKKRLILDKNNFNSTGTYLFELYEGSEITETGYVTIY